MDRYIEELKKQLDFLRRSCDIYDCEGNENEAVRIAVILRTLFRDTKNSTSLLTLLNQKDNVKLLSSLITLEESPFHHQITSSYFAHIMMTEDGQKPYLSKTDKKKNISIINWLKEIVLVLDSIQYSREDIIITTANKDGGAHVEKKLNQKATLLKKSFGNSSWGKNGRRVTQNLDNHHYINLRQFAFEVLHSKELYTYNNFIFTEHIQVKSYKEYVNEGIKYFKNKRYYKSIESYKKAISMKPKSCEDAHTNMGHSLEEIDEVDEARKEYLNAIKLNKNYVPAWFNISRLSVKEKRYDLAIEAYEKILKVDKEHKNTKHNFKVLLNHLNLPNELIYQYNNVFLESKNEIYMNYLAIGLLDNKMYQEAFFCFEKLYKISATDTVLCNLGITNLKLCNFKEAEKNFLSLSNIKSINLNICLNLLEYKLIYNSSFSDEFVSDYKIQFKEDKQALMLIDMLSIFIKVSNNNSIENNISHFNREYKTLTIDYNFKDIKNWINRNPNNLLIETMNFFEKFNNN